MRNSLFVILTLALVSLAQAGPFGLENGMTPEEIFKAGFKTDEKKCHEISGETGKLKEFQILENILSKKIKLSKDHSFSSLINDKYPNSIFVLNINEDFGLTYFSVYVHCDDIKLLDALYEKYKESIGRKYNNKFSKLSGNMKIATSFLKLKQPNEYNLNEIVIQKINGEIPRIQRFDSRTLFIALHLGYEFTNRDLAFEMKQEARKREIEEKIKDLLPKEEDL